MKEKLSNLITDTRELINKAETDEEFLVALETARIVATWNFPQETLTAAMHAAFLGRETIIEKLNK